MSLIKYRKVPKVMIIKNIYILLYLSVGVFSTVVLMVDTINEETNIAN